LSKSETRPQVWRRLCDDALNAISDLAHYQGEYKNILDNLPDNLETSPYGEKLYELCDLDIDGAFDIINEAKSIALPLGFGRD